LTSDDVFIAPVPQMWKLTVK